MIDPVITGNTMYSNDTSENKAIKGLAAAGGWIILKYIIRVTVVPTDRAKDKDDIPKNSLNNMPIVIPRRWPKKIFPGWANSFSYNTNIIREVAPKDIISQKPEDVSKLKNASIPIIIEADKPATIGSNFFLFSYIFF